MIKMLALAILVALVGCVDQWPDGTTIVAGTSRASMPLDAWNVAVDDALSMWQTELGADCPIGFTHIEPAQADASTHTITLVWPDDWTHGYNEIGLTENDSIEVYGTSPDDTKDFTFSTLVHELGHALWGPDHSSDPSDIMSTDGGGATQAITFTAATIRGMRDARGCR